MTNRFSRRYSSGSIAINTVIFFSVAAILLVGSELGYAYYIKREFQKVADLSALTGAQVLGNDATTQGCISAAAAAKDNAQSNLSAGIISIQDATITTSPGRWTSSSGFTQNTTNCNAINITISKKPDSLFSGIAGYQQATLQSTATAARATPQAILNIRSTLVSVDTTTSPVLNSVFGGLLGGNLTLSAGSWDGLAKSNINLLSYLDALAVRTGVAAGQYDAVLKANATVGQLLNAGIDVLNKDGSVDGSVAVLQGLIGASANVSSLTLQLGQVLGVQTGTPAAGLNASLQAFQLIQGIVQLANSQSAIFASVPITVPGIASASLKLKIIEPPQISAIGNPVLAKLNPDGPNRIYVQTAQVRTVLSIDLPILSTISGLLNAVTNLLAPVTGLLNSVLSLNLQALVGNILCLGCTQTGLVLIPENPVHATINLNVGAASAKVTDVDCTSAGNPTLTVSNSTSLAQIQIGQVASAVEPTLLIPGSTTAFTPIPLLDVQTRKCTTILGLTGCDPWSPYSRTGIAANTSIATTVSSYTYQNPPNINQQPIYHSVSGSDIVSSLNTTLSGLQLQTYQYSSTATNHFGALIGTATQLVQTAVSAAQAVVKNLLSPLLDPIVNLLLNTLGIQLAQADIGARLTCSSGVELVY